MRPSEGMGRTEEHEFLRCSNIHVSLCGRIIFPSRETKVDQPVAQNRRRNLESCFALKIFVYAVREMNGKG